MSSYAFKSTTALYCGGITLGAIFGMAFEKSMVFNPEVIKDQLIFKSFIMLKMFLTATAVGMLIIPYMDYLKVKPRVAQAIALGFGVMKGYGGNVTGGFILGIGLGFSGSCPGSVMAQLGAGVPSAKYFLVGGILGASAFGYLHGRLTDASRGKFMAKKDSIILDKMAGKQNVMMPIMGSLMLFTITFLVEYLRPWKVDIAHYVNISNVNFDEFILFAPLWSPILTGVVVGLLQLPSNIFLDQALGASSSYVTMAAFALKFIDDKFESKPFFKSYLTPGSYAQVGIVHGIMLGAFLSSLIGVQHIYPVLTYSEIIKTIIAGAISIIGARLAGGCTSGHGISGMARMSLASMVTVCAMFAGAILTALLTHH